MTVSLVTGVTGQDGRYLADLLVERGHEVHGVVHGGRGYTECFHRHMDEVHVQLHHAELSDGGALNTLVRRVHPDQVFHLAGVSSVGQSWEEPLLTQRVNATGTGILLDAVWRWADEVGADPHFVHASSVEIFGQPAASPQDEDTPIRPASPYGASKAAAHHLVGVYRGRGMRASNAILFNHESPQRPFSFVTRKITRAAAEIAAGRADELRLGNLDARRDWGWAPDYVAALALMAEAPDADDYVVATGESHSVRDFVDTAFGHVGLDPDRYVVVDPGFFRPADVVEQRGDATRLRTRLGWAPTVSFTELVTRMVDADRVG